MTLFKPRLKRALLFSAAVLAGIVAPAFVSAGSGNDATSRIIALEFQAQSLGNSLNALNMSFGTTALTPSLNIGNQPMGLVAQNRDTAALNLRLAQIEERVRILTGQVEGLQFQMTQFQTLIERMQEDNEFRFSQLEGGSAGKTDAVTQSDGDRPVGELPQNQNQLIPQTSPLDEQVHEGPVPLVFSGDDRIVYELPPAMLDDGQPLNLGFTPGEIVTQGDASAQYRAGFDAIMQGDYQFAESQFRQFVELFPDHELTPDAINWFGEALLHRQQFDEAAQVLLDGFEKHKNSTRGPDLLLKLGVALAGAGEKDTACRTFGEALRRYPNMDSAYELRVAAEMARVQC